MVGVVVGVVKGVVDRGAHHPVPPSRLGGVAEARWDGRGYGYGVDMWALPLMEWVMVVEGLIYRIISCTGKKERK